MGRHRRVAAHPLDPTGPYMLGRLLEDFPPDASILLGRSVEINQDARARRNIVKLLPDGQLVALRNKGANSSIEELMPGVGNRYGPLWQKGRVWRQVEAAPIRSRSILARLLRRPPS